MTLLQQLSLLWRRFSPLEDQLFAAVSRILPDDARPVFDAQVQAITHVQRLPGWTEIDYYRRRHGRVEWDGVPLFPRTAEFRLARVNFSVGRRYRATLSCVAGHIFDLATTPGPRAIAFAGWDAAPRAQLLSDPLDPTVPPPAETLPNRWLQMLTAVRAVASSDWVLHDASTTYRVTVDEGEFLVLAERDGDEFVLHRIHPPGAMIFHLPSHDGTPRPLQGDIADLFRR